MAILVTGGAGFIGSHTCVELQESGYDVVVLDNLCNSSEKSLERVEAITGKKVTFYKDSRERGHRVLHSFRRPEGGGRVGAETLGVLLQQYFRYPDACG